METSCQELLPSRHFNKKKIHTQQYDGLNCCSLLTQVPIVLFLIQLSNNTPERQQTMGQLFRPLPPAWETQLEFLVPDFDLAQT